MTIGRWRDSNDAKLVQRHSFPATVIQRPVQLYFRFTLSLRDVEEVIEVTRLRLLPRQFAVCIRIAIKLSRSSGKGLERRGANGSPGVRDFTVGVATEKTIAGRPAETVRLRRNRVDRLYRSYASALIAWLRRRYGEGPPEPEDVAQAAFLRFSGLDSIEHIEDERAFLFTIAANLAVSGIRKRCRSEAFIAAELAATGGEIEKITPERVYASKDRFRQLSVAFAGLSERQKDMVIRCRIRGQTYAEIVAETGWSLGVVAADVKAAMLALARSDDKD